MRRRRAESNERVDNLDIGICEYMGLLGTINKRWK